jgi:hypothetical protein
MAGMMTVRPMRMIPPGAISQASGQFAADLPACSARLPQLKLLPASAYLNHYLRFSEN